MLTLLTLTLIQQHPWKNNHNHSLREMEYLNNLCSETSICTAAIDMTPTLCVCVQARASRRCQSELFGLFVYGVGLFCPLMCALEPWIELCAENTQPTHPDWLNAESVLSEGESERTSDMMLPVAGRQISCIWLGNVCSLLSSSGIHIVE